jgi:hypothetical protein
MISSMKVSRRTVSRRKIFRGYFDASTMGA